jgi:hypothetical protein
MAEIKSCAGGRIDTATLSLASFLKGELEPAGVDLEKGTWALAQYKGKLFDDHYEVRTLLGD